MNLFIVQIDRKYIRVTLLLLLSNNSRKRVELYCVRYYSSLNLGYYIIFIFHTVQLFIISSRYYFFQFSWGGGKPVHSLFIFCVVFFDVVVACAVLCIYSCSDGVFPPYFLYCFLPPPSFSSLSTNSTYNSSCVGVASPGETLTNK